MAKLRRRIIETTVRWEETENLTPEQVEKWKTGGYDIQEEVMDEVEFEFSHDKVISYDKVIDDYDHPELIEDE